MKKVIVMLGVFALSLNCCEQNKQADTNSINVENKSKNPKDLVRSDEVFLEYTLGDLNSDGIKDLLIITKQTKKELTSVRNQFDEEVDRNRRGVLIAFKDSTGYYNTTLAIPDCFSSDFEDGGVYFPPDVGIDIENGNLIVHYGHGRYGWWRYTFRYRNNNFELIGYDASSNRGPIIESSISINFLTKKKQTLTITNYDAVRDDEEVEEVFEETWQNIAIEKLVKLTDIKDFDEFDIRSIYTEKR